MRSIMLRVVSTVSLMAAVACSIFAQAQLSLADLEGRWLLDGEKSFSRSERSDISNYDLRILLSGLTLTFYWDYTIKEKRSNYSQTLVVDEKRHDATDYGSMAAGARAYSAKIKGSSIKQSMSYGAYMPRSGSYMDSRILTLSEDKRTLTIETLFISTRPGDSGNRGKQKLVFKRMGT